MPSLIEEDLSAPGTLALVIGVSRYPHFDDGSDPTPNGREMHMEQLTAAARSASEFAAWLLSDYRRDGKPLKSLRVLLSPTEGEDIHQDIAQLLDGDYAATRTNVERDLVDFRNACNSHKENVLIVYVAGHGVQLTKTGAIVLLSDFGDSRHAQRFYGSIDMAGVHAGMNHPDTAQTQFWFVDACRQRSPNARHFETLDGALKLDEPRQGSARASPMFLAATTGEQPYARIGGMTLFNEALMWALSGGVADGPNAAEAPAETAVDCWHVPVTALIRTLPGQVAAHAKREGAEQSVAIAGNVNEAVIHDFTETPKVDLWLTVYPSEAQPLSRGTLSFNGERVVVEDYVDWPMRERVNAGLYVLTIDAGGRFNSIVRPLGLEPPEYYKEFLLRR